MPVGQQPESTVPVVNRLKLSDWVIVVGGALVLVFALPRWFSWEVNVGGVRGAGKTNAFDYFFTGFVPWVLLVGSAVVTVLLATGSLVIARVPWPLALLAATLLGFILILVRLIASHDPDFSGTDVDVDVSRGIGIWMSALGALIAFVGAFVGFRNTGLDDSPATPPAAAPPRPDRQIPPPA